MVKMEISELRELAVQAVGQRGWQTRLAEQLGVDPSTVRRWLSGAVAIPNPVAVAVRLMAQRHASSDTKPAAV